MLIQSDRHTAEDLRLWRNLEVQDRMNFGLRNVGAKARRAIVAIEEFALNRPCYASISWGKDSTVLAHLIWRTCLWIPCYYMRDDPCANPDSDIVQEWFLQEYRLPQYTVVPITDFRAGLRRCESLAGTGRHITGVRAEESTPRWFRSVRHGVETENSCAPLTWWSEQDVFAYLAHHNLPVHPAYAMLGAGRWPRKELRVDQFLDRTPHGFPAEGWRDGGISFGRDEWEREYYPDIVDEIIQRARRDAEAASM